MANMKFLTPQASPASVPTSLLMVGVFQDEFHTGISAALNTAANGTLSAQAQVEGFGGKHGETMVHFPNHMVGARRVLAFGLGARAAFDLTALREALIAAFRKAKSLKENEITVAPVELDGTLITAEMYGQTVAEYAGLIDYVINHHKTALGGHKPETHIELVKILPPEGAATHVRRGAVAGRIIASAVNNARDLVNTPAGVCTPSFLAAEAVKLAKGSRGAIQVKLIKRAELKKLGLNAFLAVGQGSAQEPVLIELSYLPLAAKGSEVLGLVGKSVTFDSGGLDIKGADGMRQMKGDMAGGAAVLSAMGAIAALKLPVKVKAYMAATENMPDGKAYKPGDVLTTLSGLTVEVDNTDAEGRLTLADAIEYAKRFGGATHIVDVATLTGAIRTATAHVGAGAFGNTPEFTQTVIQAALSCDELLWEMPMWPALAKANESRIADLKNSGGAAFGAGSSTAAWFLRKFAGQTPWVHLDIASVAFRDSEFGPDPAGATGWGTRTLIALAKLFSQKS